MADYLVGGTDVGVSASTFSLTAGTDPGTDSISHGANAEVVVELCAEPLEFPTEIVHPSERTANASAARIPGSKNFLFASNYLSELDGDTGQVVREVANSSGKTDGGLATDGTTIWSSSIGSSSNAADLYIYNFNDLTETSTVADWCAPDLQYVQGMAYVDNPNFFGSDPKLYIWGLQSDNVTWGLVVKRASDLVTLGTNFSPTGMEQPVGFTSMTSDGAYLYLGNGITSYPDFKQGIWRFTLDGNADCKLFNPQDWENLTPSVDGANGLHAVGITDEGTFTATYGNTFSNSAFQNDWWESTSENSVTVQAELAYYEQGDLVFVFLSQDQNQPYTWPAGWTELISETTDNNHRMSVGYWVADASDWGPDYPDSTIDITIPGPSTAKHTILSWSVRGWDDSGPVADAIAHQVAKNETRTQPTVVGRSSGTTANATTHAIPMPACNDGDLRLVAYTVGSLATPTFPASPGWEKIFEFGFTGDGTRPSHRIGLAAKPATFHDGSSIDVTTVGPADMAFRSWAISGWNYTGDFTTLNAIDRTANSGNDTTPNSPSLTPDFGEGDLWLSVVHWDSASSVTASPAGYSESFSIGSGPAIATAERTVSAASEDPPAWTLDSSTYYTASTIAIKGSADSNPNPPAITPPWELRHILGIGLSTARTFADPSGFPSGVNADETYFDIPNNEGPTIMSAEWYPNRATSYDMGEWTFNPTFAASPAGAITAIILVKASQPARMYLGNFVLIPGVAWYPTSTEGFYGGKWESAPVLGQPLFEQVDEPNTPNSSDYVWYTTRSGLVAGHGVNASLRPEPPSHNVSMFAWRDYLYPSIFGFGNRTVFNNSPFWTLEEQLVDGVGDLRILSKTADEFDSTLTDDWGDPPTYSFDTREILNHYFGFENPLFIEGNTLVVMGLVNLHTTNDTFNQVAIQLRTGATLLSAHSSSGSEPTTAPSIDLPTPNSEIFYFVVGEEGGFTSPFLDISVSSNGGALSAPVDLYGLGPGRQYLFSLKGDQAYGQPVAPVFADANSVGRNLMIGALVVVYETVTAIAPAALQPAAFVPQPSVVDVVPPVSLSPTAIAASSTISQPSTASGSNIGPAALLTTSSVPQPSVETVVEIGNTAMAGLATVVQPTIGISAAITAAALAPTSVILQPQVTAGATTTINPTVLVASSTIVQPSLSAGSTASSTTIVASSAIVQPSISAGGGSTTTITPTGLAATSTIPNPSTVGSTGNLLWEDGTAENDNSFLTNEAETEYLTED